jgi:hypothetical protein
MDDSTNIKFFESVIAAGAIIAGFCGSFLVFRIQREADFYRNPSDGELGQQYFSSSFLLIILATLLALISGVVLPLFYLSGVRINWLNPKVVVGGLLAAMVMLIGYFVNELVHYRIIGRNWGKDKEDGWRREWPVPLTFFIASILASLLWLVLKS